MRHSPELVEVDSARLEEVLRRVEQSLDEKDAELVRAVFQSYAYVADLVEDKNTSIRRLRQLFFGARTEKTDAGVGQKTKQPDAALPGARHGLHDQGGRRYPTDRNPWLWEALTYNLARTVKMGKDAAAIRNEFHTRSGQIARELGRELYPQGLPRGTRFSELEAIAGALGDEMARQRIEIPIREQADDWPEDELGECPVCGGPARKAPDQPRVLTTTRGDVAWKQRVGNCPRCRRAFFPSEPGAGH